MLYFSGTHGQLGDELWKTDNPTQMLRLTSEDPVLGTAVNVSVAGAVPGTSGALLLGAPRAALPLGSGCFLYLDPVGLAVVTPIAATSSTWSTAVPLPNVSVLSGLRVGLQAALGPTGVPLGADLTNAVAWTLGR